MNSDNNKLSGIENVAQCSFIYVHNANSVPKVDIALETLDYRRLFIGFIGDPFTINVDLTNCSILIEPGTKVILKGVVSGGEDFYCDVSVEYQPGSNVTCYFELEGHPFKNSAEIVYIGTEYPY